MLVGMVLICLNHRYFSTANNVLTIRDVVNGETLKTYIFSRNDFIDKKETSKDEMDKINIWLDEYITNSFNKTNAWDVKYIGVTQTMSSPVNTYMLNFDTTDKKLLSLKMQMLMRLLLNKTYQEYLNGRIAFVQKRFQIL